MEYELQGDGSDGRAVFISEKGDSTSWHSLILNVRHKLLKSIPNTQQHTALHPTRVQTRSQQTNHEPQRQNTKQQTNKPGGLKTCIGVTWVPFLMHE